MPQSLFVILHQHTQVQPFPTFANKGVIHLMESRTLSIFHKYIGTIQTQSALGHLPCGSEDIGSSQSASATLGMLPLLPLDHDRHASSNQASAETFPSGHLAPLQSSQWLLQLSISVQAIMNTSQCFEDTHNPLGLCFSEHLKHLLILILIYLHSPVHIYTKFYPTF